MSTGCLECGLDNASMTINISFAVGRAACVRSVETWVSPGRLCFLQPSSRVHVLYLDDAGSVGNPKDRHFVLAGIAVFERQIHWLSRELNKVAAATGHPDPEKLELHGNQILAGRGWWRRVKRPERRRTIRHGLAAARALKSSHHWRLFGVVVDKGRAFARGPRRVRLRTACQPVRPVHRPQQPADRLRGSRLDRAGQVDARNAAPGACGGVQGYRASVGDAAQPCRCPRSSSIPERRGSSSMPTWSPTLSGANSKGTIPSFSR